MNETPYDDIIGLEHHVSRVHPRMSLHDRAAQFSPFAALTGHSAAIEETARYTESEVFIDENMVEVLNQKLGFLKSVLYEKPSVQVTYFKRDDRKSGGTYVTVSSELIRIDDIGRKIVLMNGDIIPMEYIIQIE